MNPGLDRAQGSLKDATRMAAKLQSRQTLWEHAGLIKDGVRATVTHPGFNA